MMDGPVTTVAAPTACTTAPVEERYFAFGCGLEFIARWLPTSV